MFCAAWGSASGMEGMATQEGHLQLYSDSGDCGVRTEKLIFRELSDSSHRKDSFGWKVANGWEKNTNIIPNIYIYINNIYTIHACMVYLPIHLAALHGKCR